MKPAGKAYKVINKIGTEGSSYRNENERGRAASFEKLQQCNQLFLPHPHSLLCCATLAARLGTTTPRRAAGQWHNKREQVEQVTVVVSSCWTWCDYEPRNAHSHDNFYAATVRHTFRPPNYKANTVIVYNFVVETFKLRKKQSENSGQPS